MMKIVCAARGISPMLYGAVCGAALLAGCAQMPAGPTVAVMPAPNKPFDVFVQEDQVCRGWAVASTNTGGRDPAADRFLASTITGAAIGAVAGALAGGHEDAGTGAAIGTVVGAGAGVSQSGMAAGDAQYRYDVAYQQCMYSKGNIIPGYYYGGNSAFPPPPG